MAEITSKPKSNDLANNAENAKAASTKNASALGVVGKTYATALFETMKDEDSAKDTLESLKGIDEILTSYPKLGQILNSPVVSVQEKHSIIKELFSTSVGTNVYNFLLILADKGRFGHFTSVVGYFEQLFNDKYGIVEVVVTTAIPLSEKLRSKLKQKLETVTHKVINLTERVDSSILGGVLLSFKGNEIDSTVKGKLNAIQTALKGAIV